MRISIGTFNLNNLYSRFNFRARVDAAPSKKEGGITLNFGTSEVAVRTFMGRLIRQKDDSETNEIGRRIRDTINADVLAVQEVEHFEVLKQFNKEKLGRLYPHMALIEGNDVRLIDVAILSKLPLGAITSHQTAVHEDDPGRRIFGRDLLEVEILNKTRTKKLFTLYNNHLKSHFVTAGENPAAGKLRADTRRRRQAETVKRILEARERPNGRFVLLGDMNDPPESEFLAPMLTIEKRPLLNALENAVETRPPKPESAKRAPGPDSQVWTYRFNPPGSNKHPQYHLFDQIWLSDSLGHRLVSAHIDRRTKHSGNGSDHDPAWIVLDL